MVNTESAIRRELTEADVDRRLREQAEKHDARVTELLVHNNVLEQRARDAERNARELEQVIASAMNLVGEMARLLKLPRP